MAGIRVEPTTSAVRPPIKSAIPLLSFCNERGFLLDVSFNVNRLIISVITPNIEAVKKSARQPAETVIIPPNSGPNASPI